jgi:chemotaxis protein MotB
MCSKVFIILISLIPFAVGCVSTAKYQSLQEVNKKLESENKSLDQSIFELELFISKLKYKMDSLKTENKTLMQERENLLKANQDLTVSLSSSKNELLEKVSSLSSEKFILESQIEELVKEHNELKTTMESEIYHVKQTYQDLLEDLKEEVNQGEIEIQQILGKLTVTVAEKIFFDSGESKLKSGGEKVLLQIGKALKKLPDKIIQVEGHTDNVPISSVLQSKYPTNWELASARAINVVHFLENRLEIDPRRLIALSFGEHHPIVSNETAKGRAKNRRIEIIITDKSLDELKKVKEGLKAIK